MKKFFKRLILFCLIFISINLLLGSYLSSQRKLVGYYPAIRWDEFRKLENNSIDLLFLGSSHCYRALVPNVFDTLLNVNSFNMGSSVQTPFDSYYVLKEVLDSQHPLMVILEINQSNFGRSPNYESASANYDFFNDFSNKLSIIKSSIKISDLVYIIFPVYTFNNFKSLLFKTKPLKYGVDKNIYSYYSHKGYVETPRYRVNRRFSSKERSIDISDFNKKQIESVYNIIEICKKNNIELLFVTQPLPPTIANSFINYEDYRDYIKQFEIEHIDFNIKPLIDNFDDSEFYDSNHLFNDAAEKFSVLVVEEMKKLNIN